MADLGFAFLILVVAVLISLSWTSDMRGQGPAGQQSEQIDTIRCEAKPAQQWPFGRKDDANSHLDETAGTFKDVLAGRNQDSPYMRAGAERGERRSCSDDEMENITLNPRRHPSSRLG